MEFTMTYFYLFFYLSLLTSLNKRLKCIEIIFTGFQYDSDSLISLSRCILNYHTQNTIGMRWIAKKTCLINKSFGDKLRCEWNFFRNLSSFSAAVKPHSRFRLTNVFFFVLSDGQVISYGNLMWVNHILWLLKLIFIIIAPLFFTLHNFWNGKKNHRIRYFFLSAISWKSTHVYLFMT